MIEKVTLNLSEGSKFTPTGNIRCEEMNPKAMLLYAAAKCAGLTAMSIMKKERVEPKRFEISLAGRLSTDTVTSESMFLSFHIVYNVACGEQEQLRVSQALRLTHEKHCSMLQMLRLIAPVTQEMAIVSTEPAKA